MYILFNAILLLHKTNNECRMYRRSMRTSVDVELPVIKTSSVMKKDFLQYSNAHNPILSWQPARDSLLIPRRSRINISHVTLECFTPKWDVAEGGGAILQRPIRPINVQRNMISKLDNFVYAIINSLFYWTLDVYLDTVNRILSTFLFIFIA